MYRKSNILAHIAYNISRRAGEKVSCEDLKRVIAVYGLYCWVTKKPLNPTHLHLIKVDGDLPLAFGNALPVDVSIAKAVAGVLPPYLKDIFKEREKSRPSTCTAAPRGALCDGGVVSEPATDAPPPLLDQPEDPGRSSTAALSVPKEQQRAPRPVVAKRMRLEKFTVPSTSCAC